MASTTNFNWSTPDDTSLVKDGAAAIRTLGQSIDTSMAELKGGTTGQILSKTSATDMDFTWITNDQGDITAVTAGTGISGGGTSGAVTITNSMATAIDAKGDLVAGTGADAFSRLAVGSDNEVLIADSTASTGLKWGKPKGYGCSIYKSGTAQTISNGALTALTWESENWDTNAYHSTSSNTSRITIPAGLGGLYQVNGFASFASGSAVGTRDVYLGVNGSAYYAAGRIVGSAASELIVSVSAVLQLVAGDYIELFVFQNSGTSTTIPVNSGGYGNAFSVAFLGA